MIDVPLSAIEFDMSIQCRASIDVPTVMLYAERMTAADTFLPVELFGAAGRYWIGDGWHRIKAAQQIGALSISANIHQGGRPEALKHALGANSTHGLKRTNADKRRCVEIALAEFGGLSSRAIAELCGVGDDLVLSLKRALPENGNATVTTTDGRQYPAKRSAKTMPEKPTEPIPRNQPREEKIKVVGAMLAAGNNVEQIAEVVGNNPQYVRDFIHKNKLATIPHRGKNAARIDAKHVVEQTVNAITATGHGLKLIRNSEISIPKNEAAAMLVDLKDAMQSLRWLTNILKGLANG